MSKSQPCSLHITLLAHASMSDVPVISLITIGSDGPEKSFWQEFVELMQGIWVVLVNTVIFLAFANMLHRYTASQSIMSRLS